jgi:hypothetical protein
MLGTLISLAAEAPLPHPILKPQSDEIGSGRQLDHALVLQQEQRAATIGRSGWRASRSSAHRSSSFMSSNRCPAGSSPSSDRHDFITAIGIPIVETDLVWKDLADSSPEFRASMPNQEEMISL